ncbi:MAG: tRNA uridine-5-carboxymethylaminomethyl(34) synthesis GTPase MnmE [Fusobacteriaceae bacterium]|nr:tRNA uridine-5-carboxymethylaminomethyl(34) synthesis GTPase MnmE [Fusobacteriaceae bacterium]MBP6467279.1 tRNA uridine-5-carboxymethylaminomethyl(34) synthesis GTPase MnmE [Fusobacteriaceae bacterium]MBP9596270.1 tRNA uridine-5-carboxymethylaminomethyl(34) synthesis GTPase MnmE [Fusobacteriaceae bacterium]MBU9917572.1 tRNA uridine-5-carboxymethylaminomethyl(34) synthesis GTPase MnmE [Fusobacteriaceae bacterium]
MMFDTIAAISTPRGEGGIGIVRISGDRAIEILGKIFKPKSEKEIKELRNFSINYGKLYNENNELVDEVLVSIMKGTKTYTAEDIVEINCHGGYLITEKVLELVLRFGARHAEQGEFTRRAFVNGRIDLTQAEAVMDLIHSKTDKSISLSLDQLRGDLKSQIAHLKKLLLDVAAHVNVVLDYPEEGIDDPLPDNLVDNLETVMNTANELILSYDKGKMIKEGVKTAIVGKPNVGKSSLLNALLREERAIVTHIAGTTRDIIEEVINIKGIPLVLVDTAGIRKTDDLVENIGVEKSFEQIEKADFILFVVDGSTELDNEDFKINEKLRGKKVLGIVNKNDLNQVAKLSELDSVDSFINISAKESIGISDMEEQIYDLIVRGTVENSSKKLIITNIRHKTALEKTKDAIKNIFETINMGLPMDLIAVDLKEALDSLSEVTGEISTEDLLDHVFKNFCVGK